MSETMPRPEGTSPLDSSFAALRGRMGVNAGEAAVALRVVYAGAAAYAVLFVFAAVVHYKVFGTARFDGGNMVQAIWNTLHGHFLETTTLKGQQQDRLGVHVDPFLLALAPLVWIWSSPVLLSVVQVLAVASGALPVFWLARKHLASPRTAAQFAFAYLLYPATQFNAFTIGDGFHSVSLAVPLVLYAIWFLDEDRLVAFSAVALLACTTKEEIPLAVGCLGIWYAVRKGRRPFGLGVFAAGLGLTLFNFLWVVPHFSPTGVDPFAGRYAAVGRTPGGIAHKLITDPGAFAHAAASGHKAFYVVLLLVPFLGLWLLEPLLLLGAIPDLAINLLSSHGGQTSIGYQYSAGIAPFVVAASVLGASRLKSHTGRLSLWVLIATAAVALFSPLNRLPHDVRALSSPLTSAKAHAVSLIPGGVAVAASNELAGRLSARRYIYTFPTVGRARWIVVDRNDSTLNLRGLQHAARKYETDPGWRIVFSSHGVVVLQRATGVRAVSS
jgi:uncharacterized membrane protein